MRGNSNSRVLETMQNKGFCKVGNGLLLMVLLDQVSRNRRSSERNQGNLEMKERERERKAKYRKAKTIEIEVLRAELERERAAKERWKLNITRRLQFPPWRGAQNLLWLKNGWTRKEKSMVTGGNHAHWRGPLNDSLLDAQKSIDDPLVCSLPSPT